MAGRVTGYPQINFEFVQVVVYFLIKYAVFSWLFVDSVVEKSPI